MRWISFFSILLFALWPQMSKACSTCQCGDPTLTLMGVEKPFENRWRVAGEYRFRTEEIGTPGVNALKFRESKVALSSNYAPTPWAILGLTLPLVSKQLEKVNGGSDSTFQVGDLDVHGKFFVPAFRDNQQHLVGLLASMRFPTAPQVSDASGAPLDIDVQPGTGAWMGTVGAFYSYFRHPFSLYLSSAGQFSTEGDQAMSPGKAWLTTAAAQFQVHANLAFQLGLEAMWAQMDRMAGVEMADSGGFQLMTAPRVLFGPWTDWLFHVSAQIPTLSRLNGEHSMGLGVITGVTYDISL